MSTLEDKTAKQIKLFEEILTDVCHMTLNKEDKKKLKSVICTYVEEEEKTKPKSTVVVESKSSKTTKSKSSSSSSDKKCPYISQDDFDEKVANGEAICPFVITRGDFTGMICGKKCKEGINFCSSHSKSADKKDDSSETKGKKKTGDTVSKKIEGVNTLKNGKNAIEIASKFKVHRATKPEFFRKSCDGKDLWFSTDPKASHLVFTKSENGNTECVGRFNNKVENDGEDIENLEDLEFNENLTQEENTWLLTNKIPKKKDDDEEDNVSEDDTSENNDE